MSNSVGSRLCVFSHLVDIPVVFVSPLHWCRAHTHLYISLSRACVLISATTAIFFSLEWARLCHAKAACFHFILMPSQGRRLTWRLDDLVFFYSKHSSDHFLQSPQRLRTFQLQTLHSDRQNVLRLLWLKIGVHVS